MPIIESEHMILLNRLLNLFILLGLLNLRFFRLILSRFKINH
jgi:hypothetical protein